jgi:hypothetical protein
VSTGPRHPSAPEHGVAEEPARRRRPLAAHPAST